MQYHKIIGAAVVAVFALSAGSAMAAQGYFASGTLQGNLANGENIFRNGKGPVPACVTCHGQEGEGMEAMGAPALAGQFFSFLWKQLEDFAADRRTDTTAFVMNTNAKGLTEQDRIDVAAYLANTPPSPKSASNLDALRDAGVPVGDRARGKALVEYGSPVRDDGYPSDIGSQGKGVPACKSCHGFAGDGAPPLFPKIGQQNYTYLVNQLKKWRDGSRANDPMGQMQAVARKLSDEDIHNAAAYLSTASPYSLGNFRTPYDRRFDH